MYTAINRNSSVNAHLPFVIIVTEPNMLIILAFQSLIIFYQLYNLIFARTDKICLHWSSIYSTVKIFCSTLYVQIEITDTSEIRKKSTAYYKVFTCLSKPFHLASWSLNLVSKISHWFSNWGSLNLLLAEIGTPAWQTWVLEWKSGGENAHEEIQVISRPISMILQTVFVLMIKKPFTSVCKHLLLWSWIFTENLIIIQDIASIPVNV